MAVEFNLPVIRHRRLDGLATYLSAVMVCDIGVSLLTGITRLWFIARLWGRRPLAYLWRVSSVLWGVGTLIEAAQPQ